MTMALSTFDLVGVAIFAATWIAYHLVIERSTRGLNAVMAQRRRDWMKRMAARDMRMPDSITMQGLQNGSAFLASTSLIALGGALAALQAGEQAIEVFAALPFGIITTRETYDIKVIGLAGIFGYAFFEFVWAYRLFNYGSILIVCAPPFEEVGSREMEIAIERSARMNIEAGRHFNRGLRGLFFALAYLGWFVSPIVLIVTTAIVAVTQGRRQFASEPLRAASYGD